MITDVRPVLLSALLAVLGVIMLDLWLSLGFWAMIGIFIGCLAVVWGIIAGIIIGLRAILRWMGYL